MSDLGLLDTAMHALHLLGAIAWIGGMIFTSLVVAPVLRRELAGPERYRIIQLIGQRFRMVEGIAFFIIFSSGLYKIMQLGMDLDWGSAFGRILVIKLVIVMVLIVLSILHGQVWGPALVQARTSGEAEVPPALTHRVVFWVRVELVLALVVVCLGAMLRMNPF